MEPIALPDDFADFLRLLTDHEVEFLLVGGFAVALHGYPRATADMDVWIERSRANADRLVAAVSEFGFDVPSLTADTFLEPDRVIRMDVAPVRIELLTDIDGVDFRGCKGRAMHVVIGRRVSVHAPIGLTAVARRARKSGAPRQSCSGTMRQWPGSDGAERDDVSVRRALLRC